MKGKGEGVFACASGIASASDIVIASVIASASGSASAIAIAIASASVIAIVSAIASASVIAIAIAIAIASVIASVSAMAIVMGHCYGNTGKGKGRWRLKSALPMGLDGQTGTQLRSWPHL